MIERFRILLLLILAGGLISIASCRGSSNGGALPPVAGRGHPQAVAAAAVTQWNSGTRWAPASISVSWPNAPAVGDVLVVTLWNNGQTSGAPNTYAPPAGWTLVDQNTAQAYATYQSFQHIVAAGETNSYVFTPLAAQRQHAWIAVDAAGVSGVDTSKNNFINNGVTYTTPTLTPSQIGDMAIAVNMPMTTGTQTWTNPAGWNVGVGPVPTWRGEAIYQTSSSVSAVSASSTLSGAASGFSALVLLTPSSAVQSTPTPTVSASPTPVPPATPTAPPGGGGAATPSQWASGTLQAPASITVSWSLAPAAGDVLLVAFWNNGQTSGAANTYTAPPGWSAADQNSAAYATYQVFSHVVAAGEANRYVFTPAAAQRVQSWIGVDVAGASAVDKSANRFISNSTAYTTPQVTPAQPGDLAVAFNLPMTTSSPTWTNPSGWTLGTGPTSTWKGEALFQSSASTSAISESATFSVAASGFAGIVLIKPSGSVTPPTATPAPPPTPTPTPNGSADWSTMGFDIARTGYNPNEKTIGTGSFGTLHPLWSTNPNVGGFMQGQPVVAMNVNVNGTNRNMLYAGGGGGVFDAIDADTGAVVWSKQLGTSNFVCSGINSLWGIEGAPVLDRSRNRVYVPDGQNVVHALDLGTGAETSGWPVSVAPVTGHDMIHTALNFNPNNGLLYATTGTTCDISPWYGRIAAIDTSTGTLVKTFYTMQGSSGGGVWGIGGVAIDASTNNVFIAVGNADSSTENAAYGEHVVELSADLSTVIAANFPTNMPFMFDSDFVDTPLLFQPIGCNPLLAAVNKSGALLIYDRTNIAAGPTQEITISNTGSEMRGAPAYDPLTNDLYIGLPDSQGIYLPGVAAFSVSANCTLNPTPVWNGAFGATKDRRSPVVVANGVVYVGANNENAVYAFDAVTGAQLWSGALSGAGVNEPVVVNGRLYVGDKGGTIRAWTP
jgi:outer membrane protein assembly factor BamB